MHLSGSVASIRCDVRPLHHAPSLRPPLCSLLDWFLGYFLFIFLFFFAFLYFVDKIQGALLFNFKFAKMLEVCARVCLCLCACFCVCALLCVRMCDCVCIGHSCSARVPAGPLPRPFAGSLLMSIPASPNWCRLQRSRLLEANYLTNFVDRAMERNKKVGWAGWAGAACRHASLGPLD